MKIIGPLHQLGIFLFVLSMIAGRATLGRFTPFDGAFGDMYMAHLLLTAAFLCSFASFIYHRTDLKHSIKNNAIPIIAAILFLLSGIITPIVKGKGDLMALADFVHIFCSILYVIFACTDKKNIVTLLISAIIGAAMVTALLLYQTGTIDRDNMGTIISGFSFYRIQFIGYSAAMALVFLPQIQRPSKVAAAIIAHILLFIALYPDYKSAMITIPFGISITATLCFIIGAVRSGLAIMVGVLVIGALSLSHNTELKKTRWISVFNPTHLHKMEIDRRQAVIDSGEADHGDIKSLKIGQKLYEAARKREKALEGSSYIAINDTTGRLRLWKNGISDGLKSPIWGHGHGTYNQTVKGYYESAALTYTHPHNVIIEAFYSYGIIGLTLIVLAVYLLFTGAFYYIAKSNTANTALSSGVLIGSCGTIIAASIFNGDLYDMRFFWILSTLAIIITSGTLRNRHG